MRLATILSRPWKEEWREMILPRRRIKFRLRAAVIPFSILFYYLRFERNPRPFHSFLSKIFGAGRALEDELWKERETVRAKSSRCIRNVLGIFTHAQSRAILRSLVPHFPANVAFFPGRCASERRREICSTAGFR